jgi:hypothetical protein
MKKLTAVLAAAAAGLLLAGMASAATGGYDHTGDIKEYKGTATCLECHEKAGKEVAMSLHYQQQGPAPFLKDFPKDKTAGMMVSF